MNKILAFLLFLNFKSFSQHNVSDIMNYNTPKYENELIIIKKIQHYYTKVFYMYNKDDKWFYEFYIQKGGSLDFNYQNLKANFYYDTNVKNLSLYQEFIWQLLLSKSLLYLPQEEKLNYKFNRSMKLEYINDNIVKYNEDNVAVLNHTSPVNLYIKKGDIVNELSYRVGFYVSKKEQCFYEEMHMFKEAMDIIQNEFNIIW